MRKWIILNGTLFLVSLLTVAGILWLASQFSAPLPCARDHVENHICPPGFAECERPHSDEGVVR